MFEKSGTDLILLARCETSGNEMNEPHPSGEAPKQHPTQSNDVRHRQILLRKSTRMRLKNILQALLQTINANYWLYIVTTIMSIF